MRVRRATSAAAVTAVLLATACGVQAGSDDTGDAGDTSPAGADRSSGAASSSPDGSGTPATPGPTEGTTSGQVVPADFAVPAPGPRTEPVGLADIMITSDETLSDDFVQQIRGLDGVQAVATISLANVAMENKVYNVAAVDAASYRLFTEARSADFQEQWDRVAGGEAAVDEDLAKKIPLDADGNVRLGDGPASLVHVGAWAPQVERIDVVVNDKRGEALGFVPDNALLVYTGQASPESLRKPIDRLVAGTLSIQNLDAVARYGLDVDAVQSVRPIGSFADAVGVFNYTDIGGGRIAPDPAWVSSHIVTETVPILGSVTCNKYLMPQLRAALTEVVSLGLADEINPGEYAGCYYPRYIAGSTTLSNHSFGLALDLNVPGNQRGTVGEMDRGVVAIFKRWGFAWGGDWNYTDPMHFELDRIVAPG
ncbi:hypothetical protein GCM10023340_01590 [Nocardioides marinquilinus]|uniref:Peptidase M15C domain-containing protein n=1 Tax=Nocardioides marinquilinus TaxID=1210400 RepID=A0ABP9P5B7_9ACTN